MVLNNLDIFLKKRRILRNYKIKVQELKKAGREQGLTEKEINFTLRQSLNYVQNNPTVEFIDVPITTQQHGCFSVKLVSLLLILIICLCSIYLSKTAHNFVERNIQEIIYPFMKTYRLATLPLVKLFPSITRFYDESCLLENPYFQVSDMECWPCENARYVLNLTDSISNAHVGLPFLQKVDEPFATLYDIQELYLSSKGIIDSNSPRVTSTNGWKTISEVFSLDRDSDDFKGTHIEWRINRMETGRALRTLLRPPSDEQIPPHAASIGIERFLLIDGSDSPYYPLPSTEGANVFVKQLFGQRLIVLEPSPECRQNCRRLSLLLETNHILWYSWWYWRPRSLPVFNDTSISIAFMGSSV